MTVTGPIPAAGAADHTILLLRRIGAPVAPHVALRLTLALADDHHAVAQVVASLTPAQRAGLAALPDPLPPVRAVTEAMGAACDALDDAGRRALLAAAVSVDARLDAVLVASGTTMADFLASTASEHLSVAGGRVAFTDPRMRCHVHGTATLGERTAVHAALAAAYRGAGDDRMAVWHTALSTLEGDAALARPLLDVARGAMRAGASEWAHAVAREAASHAAGPDRHAAHIVAGEAALSAGLVEDAVVWLRDPSSGPDEIAARSLPAFVKSVTLREGNVPVGDLTRFVARADEGALHDDAAASVARALSLSACLHAERGHIDDAVELLALSQRLTVPSRRGAARLAWSRSWCALFGATAQSPAHRAASDDRGGDDDAVLERIAGALATAEEERFAHALGVLHGISGTALGGAAPSFADLDRALPGPLAEAHRRVAIALVEFWAGDLASARAELSAAALVAPVALPFAGLGVALARRLDVCTDGTPLPTTLALGDIHPTPHSRPLRGGVLVDRAIEAYLEGRVTESATLLSLAADAAAQPRAHGLRLPGLDEATVWAATGRPEEARAAAARIERTLDGASAPQRLGLLARTRVVTAPAGDVHGACVSAAEAARALASPYERARSEMLIGRTLAAHGDLAGARAHLVAASGLFDTAGASVWRRVCEADLDVLPAEAPISVLTGPAPSGPALPGAARGTPMTASPASDDGRDFDAACRATWSTVLTEREQDVAVLVSQGCSNREVAERLFVSVRTVEVHLGRVFTKLDVPSRVALTVLAHRAAREHVGVGA